MAITKNRIALTKQIPALHPRVDPTTVNTSAADPAYTLGGLYWKDGKIYRYVQFLDAVAYVAGHICQFANATMTAVTNDRAGGSAVGVIPAGIALKVMTQNYYGFVLAEGYYATVLTNGDDDIAAGDELMIDTGTDGACDSYVGSAVVTATVNQTTVGAALDAREKIFGHALAADVDANNTVAAYVRCI